MRFTFLIFSLLTLSANAQRIEEIKLELSKVTTLPEAHDYIRNSGKLIGDLLYLKSGTDTTALDVDLLSTEKGDLIDFESEDKKTHYFFKTIVTTYVNSYRIQYIFLDNRKLCLDQIDSLRTIILKRVGDGEPFDQLAREYSMDANAKKGGDMGWVEEGRMHSEFEQTMKRKKLHEVYIVDVPVNKWFYVVKNAHAPRVDKKVTVLWIELPN